MVVICYAVAIPKSFKSASKWRLEAHDNNPASVAMLCALQVDMRYFLKWKGELITS